MVKMLEVGGLFLIVIMFASFVGAFSPTVQPGLSPVFLGCAVTVLGIITYRKIKRDREEKEAERRRGEANKGI